MGAIDTKITKNVKCPWVCPPSPRSGKTLIGALVEVRVRFRVNPNPNLTLKLTTWFQPFLGNLMLEYPVESLAKFQPVGTRPHGSEGGTQYSCFVWRFMHKLSQNLTLTRN